jgi:predicted enzyme related to lactoylglutathione lyase
MEITDFTPGRFSWVELATSDDAAATEFYRSLFHWNVSVDSMGGDHGNYTRVGVGAKEVGGLYALMPEQRQMGVPPHWLSYVGVTSVEETMEKAKELGGAVLFGPLDVMEKGRMAVLADPAGGAFALWEPRSHCGAQIWGEPGATCWNEMITPDTQKAGAFYASLFGWTAQEMPMGDLTYTMFMDGAQPVAGMMATPPEMGEAPPCWMVYFAVGDCDEDVKRAEALGAKTCAPPMDIPEVGRMAVLSDPQGAVFSIIKLVEQPS